MRERFGDDEDAPYQGMKGQLVKMLVNMIMAANLSGCDDGLSTWTNSNTSDLMIDAALPGYV